MAAYLVLARKYRSTTFDEVVGQEHVASTLKNAIKNLPGLQEMDEKSGT